MAATLVNTEVLEYSCGFTKKRYTVQLDGKTYFALDWDKLPMPIVYDEDVHHVVSTKNWSVAPTYAHWQGNYLHKVVYETKNNEIIESNMTIDHINEFKLDNRLANLRKATMSEQNANRGSRCDKKAPLPELIQAGIVEYPRHVRWDTTEQKFVIEKHPALLKQVSDGIRKKPTISGSKSRSLSILDKYKDILAKLDELNQGSSAGERARFAEKKKALGDEYMAIIRTIREDIIDPRIREESAVIDAVRTTAPGRKKPTKLPIDCGVTVDMLPPYTYYIAATEKRGDKFTVEIDGTSWSTTGSRNKTTAEKFQEMMNHIQDMPDAKRQRMNVV
jgi:hypothetical protein